MLRYGSAMSCFASWVICSMYNIEFCSVSSEQIVQEAEQAFLFPRCEQKANMSSELTSLNWSLNLLLNWWWGNWNWF